MSVDWAAEIIRAGITSGVALIASFFGAKWAESRKLQARFEKLDHIREEMREVTRVQEDIKQGLQGGEWNRQTLWKQRLDSYTQLLRVSTDYLDCCYAVRSLLALTSVPGDDLHTNSIQLHRLRAETFKAVTVVEIFGNHDVLDTLRGFFESSRQPATDARSHLSPASLSREIYAIRELQASFVAAAREQLKGGIES
jgi:hypothetical protein